MTHHQKELEQLNKTDSYDMPSDFRFRSLTKAEKNYSQLEKEPTLTFVATKFKDRLLRRSFTLRTDREPLAGLSKKGKAIPSTTTTRI